MQWSFSYLEYAAKKKVTRREQFLAEITIVDTTIIAASPSPKNRNKARAPEMRRAMKGNAWHFGMRAHIALMSN